jgi:tRNA 2-selenouridine synthase
VGWTAHKLEGGYKTYRREVLDKLDALSGNFNYRVICGATGSGKSRLLDALAANGAQVLDLENLARHRGSVLGGLPLEEQPSQKWFDTLLVQKLESFDTARPVYVEAESNKIGRIGLPTALVTAMHTSDCVLMDATVEARVKLLMEDYHHFLDDPETLIQKLNVLIPFHGHAQLEHWSTLIRVAQFDTLVKELLEKHYDPSYLRSLGKHYEKLDVAEKIELDDLSSDELNKVAQSLHK